jgi:sulfide dehydrogenase cytochrome subunit
MNWHDTTRSKDRRRRFSAPVLVAALVAGNPVWADAPPGATACTGCHGPATPGSAIPPLDGHAAVDIVAAMQSFRSGEREATVMDRIAKGFSEEETRAIAEWLASPEAVRHAKP